MPRDGRQSVRVVMEWVSFNEIPKEFLQDASLPKRIANDFALSNLSALIEAARETGNLEVLRAEAEAAVAEKVTHAEHLLALILIELGDTKSCEPLIQKLVASLEERQSVSTGSRTTARPDDHPDLLVLHACMLRPPFASFYDKAINKPKLTIENIRLSSHRSEVRWILAKRRIGESKATIQPGDDPRLQYWFPAATLSEPTKVLKPWWTAQGGHISHLLGSGSDLLYFRYPLVGDFEVTADCDRAINASGDLGYGGFVYQNTIIEPPVLGWSRISGSVERSGYVDGFASALRCSLARGKSVGDSQ